MPLQCVSLLNGHIERESDCPLLGIVDFHMTSAQGAFAGPALIAVWAPCWGSHSAIVRAQSICLPHRDRHSNAQFFLSCIALHGSCGCGVIVQFSVLNRPVLGQDGNGTVFLEQDG